MVKPNLKSLRVFDAAARHLNFRRASDELHVTQGAVAQQVRGLEAELNIRLFKRMARGLSLTPAGQEYHAAIARALAIIDDATRKLNPDGETITISVTPSFASKWLVPRLPRLSSLHPDIRVQTMASETLADFKTDNVDLAIRQGRVVADKGLGVEKLAALSLCAVCSPGYAGQLQSISGIADFTYCELIQDGHRQWQHLFEAAGVTHQGQVLQFNQTALAMDAAINGQGVALAPRLLLDFDLSAKRLVCLWQDKPNDENGYFLVYPVVPGQPTGRLQSVMAWLKSEVAAAPGQAMG